MFLQLTMFVGLKLLFIASSLLVLSQSVQLMDQPLPYLVMVEGDFGAGNVVFINGFITSQTTIAFTKDASYGNGSSPFHCMIDENQITSSWLDASGNKQDEMSKSHGVNIDNDIVFRIQADHDGKGFLVSFQNELFWEINFSTTMSYTDVKYLYINGGISLKSVRFSGRNTDVRGNCSVEPCTDISQTLTVGKSLFIFGAQFGDMAIVFKINTETDDEILRLSSTANDLISCVVDSIPRKRDQIVIYQQPFQKRQTLHEILFVSTVANFKIYVDGRFAIKFPTNRNQAIHCQYKSSVTVIIISGNFYLYSVEVF